MYRVDNYHRRKKKKRLRRYICFDSLSAPNTKWIPREKKALFTGSGGVGEGGEAIERAEGFRTGSFFRQGVTTHDARTRCIS